MRSASSSAFRSASAKSTGLVLDAPSPSFDFFGREVVDELMEDAEFRREAPPNLAARAAAEDVMVRGTGEAMVLEVDEDEVAAELTAGEGVRPMTGGVETLGVAGADGLGVEGFDQELKKSSSVSSFGGAVTDDSTPSTTIPFGNLA